MASPSVATFAATINEIKEKAATRSGVVVAFSGGKDCCVVLDLVAKHFKRIVLLHRVMVSGLSITAAATAWAAERYGATCYEVKDRCWWEARINGLFCVPNKSLRQIPRMADICGVALDDIGIDLMATGCKKSDYWGRKLMIDNGTQFGWHPLRDWTQYHVLAYMEINKIPRFFNDASIQSTGVDLTTKSVLYLHQHHPDDFQKLCKEFPFAEAIIYRQKWYGKPDQAEASAAA